MREPVQSRTRILRHRPAPATMVLDTGPDWPLQRVGGGQRAGGHGAQGGGRGWGLGAAAAAQAERSGPTANALAAAYLQQRGGSCAEANGGCSAGRSAGKRVCSAVEAGGRALGWDGTVRGTHYGRRWDEMWRRGGWLAGVAGVTGHGAAARPAGACRCGSGCVRAGMGDEHGCS